MHASIIGRIKIGSVFIMNPTLKPQHAKPEEEEFTGAKIMFFYPRTTDIHEKHKQVGISEGIVSFFLPFTENEEPVQCISTLNFTHVMKEIEKDIWLNMVIQHPETLYNVKSDVALESETIANARFQTSLFREEDSKIFHKLLDTFHKAFYLFNGTIKNLFENFPDTFENIVEDFTLNFDKYFFT